MIEKISSPRPSNKLADTVSGLYDLLKYYILIRKL